VRHRDVPLTDVRRFVVVETEVRAQLNFAQSIQIKTQINRCVVSGIATDDDERLDFAGVDIGDEFCNDCV
jgi:hypothetical protein